MDRRVTQPKRLTSPTWGPHLHVSRPTRAVWNVTYTMPLLRFERERMQLVYELILLNKILRNHLLSETLQWNYASFNVTLIYLPHDHGILCDTFFGLDSTTEGKNNCQNLGNKPNSCQFQLLSTDLPSNFWKIDRLLNKIKKKPGSLRFISLSFPSKN